MKLKPSKHTLVVILCILFCCSVCAHAQTSNGSSVTGFTGKFNTVCPRLSFTDPGDSSLAILSSHHKRYTHMVAQLGYIDTTSATVDEVYNNLKIGLLVFPSGNYEVCSFCVSRIDKRTDPIGPVCYKGIKIPETADYLYKYINQSTLLEFTNVRKRRKGTTETSPLPDFWIRVR